jgi:hypothetical protein
MKRLPFKAAFSILGLVKNILRNEQTSQRAQKITTCMGFL